MLATWTDSGVKMKKGFLKVLSCMLLLSAIGQADERRGPLRVGATLPLSGNLAYIGQSMQRGLELGLEDLRADANAYPLELFVEDNAGDPRTAVTNVSKLLQSDNVGIIFSGFTHITQAIKAPVVKMGAVLVYASTNPVMASEDPGIFQEYFSNKTSGASLARYFMGLGLSRLVFLSETSDTCESCEEAIASQMESSGLKFQSRHTYYPGETDFRATLMKIKLGKPQAIIACTWRDNHLIMRQLKELGMINIPVYHLVAPFLPVEDTPEIRRLYEENRSVTTWYGYIESTRDTRQLSLIERYRKRFGEDPRPDVLYAYDDMLLFSRVAGQCDKSDTISADCLRKQLLETELDGVAGRLKFDSERRSNRETFLMKVVNGKWQKLD